jgi:hypothetical protein
MRIRTRDPPRPPPTVGFPPGYGTLRPASMRNRDNGRL